GGRRLGEGEDGAVEILLGEGDAALGVPRRRRAGGEGDGLVGVLPRRLQVAGGDERARDLDVRLLAGRAGGRGPFEGSQRVVERALLCQLLAELHALVEGCGGRGLAGLALGLRDGLGRGAGVGDGGGHHGLRQRGRRRGGRRGRGCGLGG